MTDLLPLAVLVIDTSGAAHFANRAWLDLSGQQHGEWRSEGWLDVLAADDRAAIHDGVLAAGGAGCAFSGECAIGDLAGGARQVRIDAAPDVVEGRAVGIVVTVTDVTLERARFGDLIHQATHDHLTGHYNRAQFAVFVEHALDRRRREPTLTAAVVFVDVDDLKGTNDEFGHEAGDRVLQAIGDRIASAVRPGDVVARWGGDEFVVLCEDLHDEVEGIAIAHRVRAAILEPYDGDGLCSAAVGVAAADGRLRAAELLRAADRAMYHEKRASTRPRDEAELSPLAVVAREMRGPLMAITGFASLLAGSDGLDAEDVRRAVAAIDRHSKRLLRILDGMVDPQ